MTLVGVFAAIASIVGAFAALLIVAVFSRPPIDGRPFRELSNLRHLGIATMLYANDNDDRFPPADTWEVTETTARPPEPAWTGLTDAALPATGPSTSPTATTIG